VQSNVLSNYTEEEENVTLMLFFANSHNDKTLVVAKYDPTAFSPRKTLFLSRSLFTNERGLASLLMIRKILFQRS